MRVGGDAAALSGLSARLVRRAAVAATAGVCVFCALGPATPPAATVAAPPPLVLAPAAAGLGSPGWTPPSPAERSREAAVLATRERSKPLPGLTALLPGSALPPASVTVPTGVGPATTGGTVITASSGAVEVAMKYALAQLGKPYVWGAEGPDSYDCSGLVQASYAAAGVALPRTSREQALVGKAVALSDLQVGDLVFWAYDPSNLATVHHVAMYAGDGLVIQAPQPGEFVEIERLWLDGYAGAVRVATGGAGSPIALPPSTSVELPPPGTPPGATPPAADAPPTAAPSTTAPGTTPPGTTPPGTTPPGTTPPGTTPPGTTAPGTTAPSTTAPPKPAGTPTESAATSGSPTAGTDQPSPGLPSATRSTPAPTTPAPTTPAPTTPAPTTPPPTTTPPETTPPPPPTSTSAAATSPPPASTSPTP